MIELYYFEMSPKRFLILTYWLNCKFFYHLFVHVFKLPGTYFYKELADVSSVEEASGPDFDTDVLQYGNGCSTLSLNGRSPLLQTEVWVI